MRRTTELSEHLRDRGFRVTRPRRAVWRVLVDAERHLTAEQVAERVARREPGVNLASVYRSLALFTDLELVRESRIGDDDVARWELSHPDEHFHVVCERCGAVDHHVGDIVERLVEHLREGHDFAPRSVDLTVAGICGSCQRAADA